MGIDGNAGAQGFGEDEDIPHQGGVGQYVLFWPRDLRVRTRDLGLEIRNKDVRTRGLGLLSGNW